MLKIRLRRIGKKRTPYYRVVVAEKQAKRDGAFLEVLGSYDPHANPPAATLDEEKTREWIRKGAQPSDAAIKVLRRVGILEAPVKAVTKEPAKGKGKAGAKAPAPAAKAEAPAAAAAVAVAEAPAVVAEAPAVVDEAVAEAEAEAEVEAVVEAAVEGGDSNEAAQEPGDDDVSAEPPTVE